MKQKPNNQIVIDSDRSTIVGMLLVLLVCVATVILQMRLLFLGRIMRVSWGTILIALCCPVLAISFKEMRVKLALVLIGLDAIDRICMSCLHTSYAFKHFAALCGIPLKIVGLLILIYVIGKWLRSVIRRTQVTEPEGPTP